MQYIELAHNLIAIILIDFNCIAINIIANNQYIAIPIYLSLGLDVKLLEMEVLGFGNVGFTRYQGKGSIGVRVG